MRLCHVQKHVNESDITGMAIAHAHTNSGTSCFCLYCFPCSLVYCCESFISQVDAPCWGLATEVSCPMGPAEAPELHQRREPKRFSVVT